LLDDRDRFPT